LNASALGRVCAIRQLVKSNADINRKGPFGFTPLHAAAQNGHRDCVQILLDNGAEVNAQNDDMDTPLHLALATQQIEIAYLLLRNGSNVFIKGFMDKDCVQTALDARLVDLAKFLEKYGLCKKHHNSVSY
jgi:ankyrin repeat protein